MYDHMSHYNRISVCCAFDALDTVADDPALHRLSLDYSLATYDQACRAGVVFG